jgi:hypothetical protein
VREFHGVIGLPEDGLSSLKRPLLLFDKLHVVDSDVQLDRADKIDFEFLLSRGVVFELEEDKWMGAWANANAAMGTASGDDFLQSLQPIAGDDLMAAIQEFVRKRHEWLTPDRRSDYMVRYVSTTLTNEPNIDAVPVCQASLPSNLLGNTSAGHVLSIAVEALPLPDQTCAWQDILDFRAELRDQRLDFRHWLKTLATKPQTDGELRDELEYTVSQYRRAMTVHKLQASQSAFEAYVIPAIEFVENFAKFNWSKLAKLGVSGRQRRIELMKAELTAPGKECAYVFEARKRFGQP